MEANERARDLADRFWDGLLELEPILGTVFGDERFDDRLSDPGEAGRAAARSLHEGAMAEVAAIDRAELDEVNRTTLDVLESIAGRSLAELEHRTDRLVVANQMVGPVTLPGELSTVQRADTPDRLDRYEARLRAIPAFLDACGGVMNDGVQSGVLSPRVVVERAISMLDRMLALEAADSPFVQPAGEDAEAKERVSAVVRDVVNPAYAEYRGRLGDYVGHATESIGLSELPDGAAIYDAEILAWTTLPLSANEVHELGTERWDSIQAERFEVAKRLGFDDPNAAIADRRSRGANQAADPETLVAMAEDQVRRSWEAAPAFFGIMPAANCVVRRVPEFMEADTPSAYYYPPIADGSRPGTYFINCSDLPARPLHQLASITYHEANPGHHFQTAIEQELPDRPALRRFGGILAGSAFAEGWGLYSERLADEMGLYLDDWERLGMLDAQAWRAGRLITDTGIHALGWDRDRAIHKLEEGGTPTSDAAIEIDRYIAIPGQALSYMIGMIEVERARAAMAKREGSAFALPDFHDRVLTLGQIPLTALRREIGSSNGAPTSG